MRNILVAIATGIVLSQPILPYSNAIVISAIENGTIASPANLSIKTGVPSAQVQAEIECTSDPSVETQTITTTASDTGRATIRYERVEGMSYTISLTVNGKVYTMADSDAYTATCDGLTVEGIRAGVDAEGLQTLTVTVSLADVPEAPAEPQPEKPAPVEPETPTEGEQKTDVDSPNEDTEAPKKGTESPTAQVQKVDGDSTITQGMPTGCRVWNPLVWLINLFSI